MLFQATVLFQLLNWYFGVDFFYLEAGNTICLGIGDPFIFFLVPCLCHRFTIKINNRRVVIASIFWAGRSSRMQVG